MSNAYGYLFEGSWARIARASVRRQEIDSFWSAYIREEPYDFDITESNTGALVLVVRQVRPIPPEISILFGEWLYNLRGCLDNVIWATAVFASGKLPPSDEEKLQFPIFTKEKDWESSLKRLKALEPQQISRLKNLQPFKSANNADGALAWINELARRDRHRALLTMTSVITTMDPVVCLPAIRAHSVEMKIGQRLLLQGSAEIAQFDVVPKIAVSDFSVNPRVQILPEVEMWAKSTFWNQMHLIQRMEIIEQFVSFTVVAAFEYECTGESRAADILSPAFKSECAGLRGKRPEIVSDQRKIDWSAPIQGYQVDSSTFYGMDFQKDTSGMEIIRFEDPGAFCYFSFKTGENLNS